MKMEVEKIQNHSRIGMRVEYKTSDRMCMPCFFS